MFLLVIKLLGLMLRLKGDIDAQLFEQLLIHMGENNRGVSLAALELVQLFDGIACHGVCDRADGQGHQQFVSVQAGIAVAHMLNLKVLYRLYYLRRDKVKIIFHACKGFKRIEKKSRRCTEQ